MRRRALVIGAALTLLVAHLLADSLGSGYVLARHVGPGSALERDGAGGTEQVPVAPPAGVSPPTPGSAVPLTLDGISYGYAVTYAMPGGRTVSCAHRGPWSRCSDGWRMVWPQPSQR